MSKEKMILLSIFSFACLYFGIHMQWIVLSFLGLACFGINIILNIALKN